MPGDFTRRFPHSTTPSIFVIQELSIALLAVGQHIFDLAHCHTDNLDCDKRTISVTFLLTPSAILWSSLDNDIQKLFIREV